MNDDNGYVYFLLCMEAGKVKIGYTKDVKKRLRTLQSANPHILVIPLVLKGNQSREKGLHERFDKHRLHHEWFNYDGDLIEYMMSKIYKRERMILRGDKPCDCGACHLCLEYKLSKRGKPGFQIIEEERQRRIQRYSKKGATQ